MSRRERGSLFVGRLSKDIKSRDLDDIFEKYGPVDRCDIKYGAEMAYAFVDFADRLDAEEVMKYENGRELLGSEIVIEWAKGNPRRTMGRFSRGSVGGGFKGSDECFRCHRRGHWAKDCRGRPRGSGGGGGGRWRRSRSRDRHRRRRSYSRSRSRSRSRDRKRSRRDRDRRRSASRSRSRSSRSASRSRSRTRDRSRSKSRDRSRSKSRGHSRSKSAERSQSHSTKPEKADASPKNGENNEAASGDKDD